MADSRSTTVSVSYPTGTLLAFYLSYSVGNDPEWNVVHAIFSWLYLIAYVLGAVDQVPL